MSGFDSKKRSDRAHDDTENMVPFLLELPHNDLKSIFPRPLRVDSGTDWNIRRAKKAQGNKIVYGLVRWSKEDSELPLISWKSSRMGRIGEDRGERM